VNVAGYLVAVAIIASALAGAEPGRRVWIGWVAGLTPLMALPARMMAELMTPLFTETSRVTGLDGGMVLFVSIPIAVLALASQRVALTGEAASGLSVRAGLQLGMAGLVYGSGLESFLSGNLGLLVFTGIAFVGVIVLPELLIRLQPRGRESQ
jgi:hypothetical protein